MPNMNDLVSVVMQGDPISVSTDATVRELAMLMEQENVGSVIVTEKNRVEGIITDRDLVTKVVAFAKDPERVKVSEIMTRNPITMNRYNSCADALEKMADFGLRRLPVVAENKELVGVISISDLSSALRSCDEHIEDILRIVNEDVRSAKV